MASNFLTGTDELRRQTTRVTDDGRFNVVINHKVLAKFRKQVHQNEKSIAIIQDEKGQKPRKQCKFHWHRRKDDFEPILHDFHGYPRMNVAILIVGSRGDVQPFIALGNVLQAPPYNHRVRICTHPNFKDFVLDNGLEFFSIGGDPEKLMSYMVRNPGVLPSLESMKAGDVGARRSEIDEMLTGCWRACTEAGNGIDPILLPKASELNSTTILKMPEPFVADAIISNPPAYANIHIAEKLAVPLHMMFTMPWSPTTAFAHPLANLQSTKGDRKLANYLSYHSMEMLTSEGLMDLINDFRENTLALDPLHAAWAHTLLPQLKVPFTYCWSPALIPKPADWGPHISISGFFFLESQSSFKPDVELQQFLDDGPPPIYVGFGSIVVDDPDKMTTMVLDAIRKVGVRALVSKGWGNIGGADVPENVFLLGNVPHDWLFPRCSAVVHHGGAGTTAIGIALGLPTVIVPFFGDQPFWGEMVHRAGAGPSPIPYKHLTAEDLASQIRQALQPDTKKRAKELSDRIKDEHGTQTAAQSFSETPQMQNLNCFLLRDRVGEWRLRRTNIVICHLAAAVLIYHKILDASNLKPLRKKRWYVEQGAQDPLIGILGALGTTTLDYVNCFSQLSKDLRKPNGEVRHSSKAIIDGEEGAEQEEISIARSLGRFGKSFGMTTIRAPVDILYNITNGFHNAPLYYLDDETVRVRSEIRGLGSGLKVGAQELCFGFYDAFTGLVTQPYHGCKDAKAKEGKSMIWGLTKGAGRALGGLICKSSAAALSIPSYGLKGLQRSISTGWQQLDAPDKAGLQLLEYIKSSSDDRGAECDQFARDATLRLVTEARGNSVGKKIRSRKGWQGYMEMQRLRQEPEKAAVVEQKILDLWKRLEVPPEFVSTR